MIYHHEDLEEGAPLCLYCAACSMLHNIPFIQKPLHILEFNLEIFKDIIHFYQIEGHTTIMYKRK